MLKSFLRWVLYGYSSGLVINCGSGLTYPCERQNRHTTGNSMQGIFPEFVAVNLKKRVCLYICSLSRDSNEIWDLSCSYYFVQNHIRNQNIRT